MRDEYLKVAKVMNGAFLNGRFPWVFFISNELLPFLLLQLGIVFFGVIDWGFCSRYKEKVELNY